MINNVVVACRDPLFGVFEDASGCYLKREVPQPPPSDPAWEGHYPNGAIYLLTCPGVRGTGGGWAWRATPPGGQPGGGPQVSPQVLAEQAVRQLTLRGAAIRMAPPAGAVGLVHVPVWMWTPVTPQTWGPATATASVPGLSVTATATATRIVWSMGDGHTVTCTGPGTPYRKAFGAVPSPTCGHVYEHSSAGAPGGRFPVVATTTWRITWAGGGQSGALTTTRTASAAVRVGELQVVT